MRGIVDVAVIGAGPYGLSLAAHLRSRNVDYRIFGVPMGSWKENMPQGMLLKSYPWASNLSEANSQFTVKRFCGERGIPYHDSLMPLPLETFISYGEAFQEQFVPHVEHKLLMSLDPVASGFRARFDDGEVVRARRVVLAVGLSAFRSIPAVANGLPLEFVSHSADYGPLDVLDGKEIAVVGSGSSATDLSALLHEREASVSLVARGRDVNFACTPRPRSLLQRVIAPTSGIGNGWTMSICAKAPRLVHMLGAERRTRLANSRALGPLGGALMRDRVIGKVPLRLGYALNEIGVVAGKVDLRLTSADGTKEMLRVDHVVFATGYRTDLRRLGFLAPELVDHMRMTGTAPQLSRHYESSIPGLHFIGPAAANSFGPVCRFVYGTHDPARHLAAYLPAVLGSRHVPAAKGLPIASPVLQ